MGSSATFVLVETVGLTLGINPPNSPTNGVAISKFQKFPRMEIGIPITMKLQKAQYQYKNLAWTTPTPSSPMWKLLHHLSRFNNWQPSSGTFSTMTGMPTWQLLERLEDPDDDLSRHPVQIFSAADLAHLASHLAESTRTLSDQARRMEASSDEAL